jgi:hypothetical protein
MYEYSLRHQVWVPEINVRACNSVHRIVYTLSQLLIGQPVHYKTQSLVTEDSQRADQSSSS